MTTKTTLDFLAQEVGKLSPQELQQVLAAGRPSCVDASTQTSRASVPMLALPTADLASPLVSAPKPAPGHLQQKNIDPKLTRQGPSSSRRGPRKRAENPRSRARWGSGADATKAELPKRKAVCWKPAQELEDAKVVAAQKIPELNAQQLGDALQAFYRRWNPARLGSTVKICAAYLSKQSMLNESLRKQYGADLRDVAPGVRVVWGGSRQRPDVRRRGPLAVRLDVRVPEVIDQDQHQHIGLAAGCRV